MTTHWKFLGEAYCSGKQEKHMTEDQREVTCPRCLRDIRELERGGAPAELAALLRF